MPKARAHVIISGFVQGVFFRSFIRSQAKLHEIVGWCRNTGSGQLEAVFEGDKDRVQEMIEDCERGPPNSRVGDVTVEWEEFSDNFTSFEIR